MDHDEEVTLEEALENLSEATRLLRATHNLARSSGMTNKLDYQNLNRKLLSALAMAESAYIETRCRARHLSPYAFRLFVRGAAWSRDIFTS